GRSWAGRRWPGPYHHATSHPKEPPWTGSPPSCPPCHHPPGRYSSASSPGSAPRSRSPCWPSRPIRAGSTRARAGPGGERRARRFASPQGALGAVVAAAGELVADKLPVTPGRTAPGPLFSRLVAGATVGAAVHYDAGHSRSLGAALGLAGAGIGAVGGDRLRDLLADRTGLPQPLLGAGEDLFAVALALAVVTAGRDPG